MNYDILEKLSFAEVASALWLQVALVGYFHHTGDEKNLKKAIQCGKLITLKTDSIIRNSLKLHDPKTFSGDDSLERLLANLVVEVEGANYEI